MLQGTASTGAQARKLRGEMTLPERLLWNQLKLRPDGLKFRRQHPSGPYVADFYCHAARLIVEIDGRAHDHPDRFDADRARDDWFAVRGLRVIRIPASDVLRDPVTVARSLTTWCLASSATPAASSATGGVSVSSGVAC